MELIHKSLVITGAIKQSTNIWYTEGNTLDFSKATQDASVAVIYNEPSDTVKDGRNVVICLITDLKQWIREHRELVQVKNPLITIPEYLFYTFDFAKFRGFKLGEYEEPKPIERLEPNGMEIRPVEVRKGVFKDYWYKDGEYYDIEWGRGWTKDGVTSYKAVVPIKFKMVEV